MANLGIDQPGEFSQLLPVTTLPSIPADQRLAIWGLWVNQYALMHWHTYC